jgi:hypothetical protein
MPHRCCGLLVRHPQVFSGFVEIEVEGRCAAFGCGWRGLGRLGGAGLARLLTSRQPLLDVEGLGFGLGLVGQSRLRLEAVSVARWAGPREGGAGKRARTEE